MCQDVGTQLQLHTRTLAHRRGHKHTHTLTHRRVHMCAHTQHACSPQVIAGPRQAPAPAHVLLTTPARSVRVRPSHRAEVSCGCVHPVDAPPDGICAAQAGRGAKVDHALQAVRGVGEGCAAVHLCARPAAVHHVLHVVSAATVPRPTTSSVCARVMCVFACVCASLRRQGKG